MDSAGIGKGRAEGQGGGEAKLMLDEEEFKRGVSVEEYTSNQGSVELEGEKRTLKAEDVKRVLFEGKTFDSNHGEFSLSDLSLAVQQ